MQFIATVFIRYFKVPFCFYTFLIHVYLILHECTQYMAYIAQYYMRIICQFAFTFTDLYPWGIYLLLACPEQLEL